MPSRRYAVPFDPEYFTQAEARGERIPPLDAFRQAYAGLWSGNESQSGAGSSLEQTATIRRALPPLCSRLGVGTLLDLPCGDFHWMSAVDLGSVSYIGADLLPELIEANSHRFARQGRTFRVLDLVTSQLPDADLLLCRDCLVHLSFADIASAVANIRASRTTYLLTTTFPGQQVNEDIATGDWRPINLQAAPFGWPPPEQLLTENCTEGGGLFADKSLGLWRVEAIPMPPAVAS